jgi:hypothetical protein
MPEPFSLRVLSCGRGGTEAPPSGAGEAGCLYFKSTMTLRSENSPAVIEQK